MFQLARGLSFIAPVLESIGFLNFGPAQAAICIPSDLVSSFIDQKIFKNINNAERNALEKNALSLIAEQEKDTICRFESMWWPFIGGVFILIHPTLKVIL